MNWPKGKTLAIAEWDRYFENGESRKVEKTSWVAMPNKQDGKSFRRIMLRPDSSDILAGWMILLQVASKMPCRGLFADEGGVVDLEDIAIASGMDIGVLKRTIEVLHSHKIRWVEFVDVPGSIRTAGKNPKTIEIPAEVQDLDIFGESNQSLFDYGETKALQGSDNKIVGEEIQTRPDLVRINLDQSREDPLVQKVQNRTESTGERVSPSGDDHSTSRDCSSSLTKLVRESINQDPEIKTLLDQFDDACLAVDLETAVVNSFSDDELSKPEKMLLKRFNLEGKTQDLLDPEKFRERTKKVFEREQNVPAQFFKVPSVSENPTPPKSTGKKSNHHSPVVEKSIEAQTEARKSKMKKQAERDVSSDVLAAEGKPREAMAARVGVPTESFARHCEAKSMSIEVLDAWIIDRIANNFRTPKNKPIGFTNWQYDLQSFNRHWTQNSRTTSVEVPANEGWNEDGTW